MMISTDVYEYIRNTIFTLVGFEFDGEVAIGYYDGVKVEFDGVNAKIGCKDKSTLARGLFLLALNSKNGAFSVCEKAVFESLFVHLDVSRGRVLKVDTVKKYIEYMAALGFNGLTLYMEDVFHMEKYPRLGYMRGRYEIEELKEIDDYAYSLGIEVFPTVQTLGHMEQYLRWPEAAPIKDSDECMLVGVEETYEFIEEIFKTMRKAFRSDRISIGVDETHTLGLGNYLKKNGYREKKEIIREHLARVCELCEKYDYKPIMYSDMFFRSKTGGGYYVPDVDITEKDVEGISEDMTLCYWDYYHSDKDFYDRFIATHKKFNRPLMFLGSIWNWEGFWEDAEYTYRTSVPAIFSCIENNVKEFGIAVWADDGAEADITETVSTLPLFSEMCYKGGKCSVDEIDRVSHFLKGITFSDKLELSRINCGVHQDRFFAKRFFYTDIFYDIIDIKYDYETVMQEFGAVFELTKECENGYFTYCNQYSKCVMKKCEILNKIRVAYKNNDREYLQGLCDEILPGLISDYREFHKLFTEIWHKTSKPFGLEITDIRMGGAIMRMEGAINRIKAYLNGMVNKIDELEEEHINCNMWTFPTATKFMSPAVEI